MVHHCQQRPELMNSNKANGVLAGYIGPVSKVQIEALQKQNTAD